MKMELVGLNVRDLGDMVMIWLLKMLIEEDYYYKNERIGWMCFVYTGNKKP
ncbi:hypothetical protein HanRHA438_Chr10g0463561 [Helianthus annuus]|nr:hypothetical protein HanRHA438_Chr10g0463561 [Helianthus annuus]